MFQRIKKNWARSSDDLADSDGFWKRTAANWLRYKALESNLKQFGRGRLLDAGAGKLSARSLARRYCQKYVSVDFQKTHRDLDHVASLEKLPFEGESFDTVLCSEVLEHVPHPSLALSELQRVLKKGGFLIVTVPHYIWAHNEPYDYYRYTRHGLRILLEEAGFVVEKIYGNSGPIAFLHHGIATAVLGLTYGIPGVGMIVLNVNGWVSRVVAAIDDFLGGRNLLAHSYCAVVKKL